MSERWQSTPHEIEVPVAASLAMEIDTERRILTLDYELSHLGGFVHEDLGGADLDTLIHPDTPRIVLDDMWRALEAGRPWSGVIKHGARGGGYFWLAVDVVPVRIRGRVCCYKWVGMRALRQRIDQAEEVYRSLAEFRDTPAEIVNGRIVARHVFARLARWGLDVRLRSRLMAASLGGIPLALAYVVAIGVPSDSFMVLVPAILICGGTGAFLTWLMARSLTLRMRDAGSVLETMARGDFHSRIDCDRDDEVGRLFQRLKILQVRLGFDDPDPRSVTQPGVEDLALPAPDPADEMRAASRRDEKLVPRAETGSGHGKSERSREALSLALRHLERVAFRSKILSLNLALRDEDGESGGAAIRDARECARLAADGVSILRARLGMEVADAPADRRQHPAGHDVVPRGPVRPDAGHPEYDPSHGESGSAARVEFRSTGRTAGRPARRSTRPSRMPVPKIGRTSESRNLLEDDWEEFEK